MKIPLKFQTNSRSKTAPQTRPPHVGVVTRFDRRGERQPRPVGPPLSHSSAHDICRYYIIILKIHTYIYI